MHQSYLYGTRQLLIFYFKHIIAVISALQV